MAEPQAAYNPDHPENMPEVPREITMIRGALEGVGRRVDDLRNQLKIVRLQKPEAVSESTKGDEPWPVYSDLGKQLRDVYREISQIEDALSGLTGELAL